MQRRAAAQRKSPSQQISPNNNVAATATTTNAPGNNNPIATVVRHKCGTSPFDKYWLNFDCCGLFCAGLTYCLHLYGCYAVCKVLLPPWMSTSISAEGKESNDDDRKVRV